MAVEVKKTQKNMNNLLLEFVVNKYQVKSIFTYTSLIYTCGVNGFQVKIDVALYSVHNQYTEVKMIIQIRFIKMITQDNLSYICKVSSDVLNITDFSVTDNEIWYHFHSLNKVYKYDYNRGVIDVKDQEFDLDVTIHAAPIGSPFANLYEDTELTDFKLHCEKGTVDVHKTVLACASPVFYNMLSGQWKETNEGHVKIPVAKIEVLEKFKEYIYLYKLPDDDLESLIELGSYYMMPELLQRCTVKLVNNLSVNNVFEMLHIATRFKAVNLLGYILKLVKNGVIEPDNIPELGGIFEDCKPEQSTTEQEHT